jgi:hypothetical protein
VPNGVRRWQERCVRAAVTFRALTEGVALDDSRIAWVRAQAEVCISEGMPAWEAVRLAWDIAFRHYGCDPTT